MSSRFPLARGLTSISVAWVVAVVNVDEVDDEISSSDVTEADVEVMQEDMPMPLDIEDADPEIGAAV
jgi:hypothetical protein